MNAQLPQSVTAAATRNRRVQIVLVSREDEFLIELGPVLGDRYRVHTVDNLAALGNAAGGSPCIALIDADGLGDGAAAQLRSRPRGTPAIVITAEPAAWGARGQDDVVAILARGDIGDARLVEALHRAEERLQVLTAAAAIAAPAANDPPPAGKPPLLIAAAVAAACAAVAGGWLLHRSHHALSPVPAPGPAITAHVPAAAPAAPAARGAATAPMAAPGQQSVFELLSAARVALHDGKLLPHDPPRADSAVELYAQVLIQDPHNDEAADGVRRLFSAGRPVIENDIATGRLDDAGRLLSSFHAAGADADALRQLDAALAAARPRWLATHAREAVRAENLTLAQQLIDQLAAGGDTAGVADLRHELDTKKTEIQLRAMAADVHAAITAGALTEPAGDSALSRLQAMRNVNRSHPLTLAAQHDLQAALLARSQDAARHGQFDTAQRALAAAADVAPSPEVNVAKRQLQADMEQAAQQAAQRSAAAARAAAAPPNAPPAANPNAAPAAPVARPAARASGPLILAARTTAPLDVQYPPRAMDAGIKGYAIVEFTLQPDGRASDADVVEAKPRGLFDSAATSAVLRGHFDSSSLTDGLPRRARIRINFDPG